MNNGLIIIQEMMMREMERLDNCEDNISQEVARSNALANNVKAFINSINIQLRIKEVSEKFGQTKKSLTKELGIDE